MEVEIVATGGGILSVIRGHPLKYPYHLPAISGAMGKVIVYTITHLAILGMMPGNDARRCNTAQDDAAGFSYIIKREPGQYTTITARALLTN